MATEGSISHDDVSCSHPAATRGEGFDTDMASLAACVGVGGSEQAVLHLRNMRLRYDTQVHSSCMYDVRFEGLSPEPSFSQVQGIAPLT